MYHYCVYYVQGEESEISNDKITAYNSDLDYLDDHFQVRTMHMDCLRTLPGFRGRCNVCHNVLCSLWLKS